MNLFKVYKTIVLEAICVVYGISSILLDIENNVYEFKMLNLNDRRFKNKFNLNDTDAKIKLDAVPSDTPVLDIKNTVHDCSDYTVTGYTDALVMIAG